MRRRRRVGLAAIAVLLGLFLSSPAFGQEETPNYSGEFWTRSTLTGDWGGIRNDLAKKGVTIDFNVTQIGQGNVDGGKKINWQYGGRGDLTLNVDTQKLGLWPGGFITVEVEGNWDKSVNPDTGALSPVNTNQVFPMTGSDQLNIPAVSVTQFLSHHFGVFIGKVATITPTSGDMNEFAHGKGDTQFFNTALNFNPAILVAVPYSTLAAGAVILPTSDPKEAIVSVMAYDGNGEANSSGFDTVLKGNTAYAGEGRVRTGFFGKTGHQLVGGVYSTRNYTSLNQNLRIIIENRAIQQEENSWAIYYNFDQYLYEPKKEQGVGIFGRFGISDGKANPVHHFYSLGIGGKGAVPGRPLDQFGLGWYYIDVSNPSFTGPFATTSFLRDEQGLEAYYNFAITPWARLTPDVQIVRPAQINTVRVNTSPPPPVTVQNDIDTATIVGLRLELIF
jgi:porin